MYAIQILKRNDSPDVYVRNEDGTVKVFKERWQARCFANELQDVFDTRPTPNGDLATVALYSADMQVSL